MSPPPMVSGIEADRRHFPIRTLLGLTALAAAVRVVGLDAGLWIDEIYSLLDSFRPPLSRVFTVFPGDTQHPLYSVFANVSLKLLGESPWTIRLPAVLFGVASVPMLYVVGRRIAGAREALLASALLAVSYHHVWFSQNARGYTMLAFWALLSTHLLYLGLREGGRRRFVLYGVVIGLAVYTHLTMAFMVAAHALVAFAWTLRNRASDEGGTVADAFVGFGVGVVTGALLYAPVFLQVFDFFLNQPSRLEGVSTPTWALFEALRVLRVGMGAWIGLLLAGILVGSGVLSYARRDGLALSLFAGPAFVTLFGALLARGTMYPRFYFFLIGFAFLILVRGAFVIGDFVEARIRGRDDETSRKFSAGLALSLLMITVSAISLRTNYLAPKQDFGGALAYVEAEAAAGDVIATTGVTTDPYRRYFGRSFTDLPDVATIEEQRSRGATVWVLYTFARYIEASDAALAQSLREECETARVFPGTVGGGEIIVCRYRSATPPPGGNAS